MLVMACSYPCDPEVHAGTPKDVEGVIGNVLLTLPFYKHIFAWMGAHPAGIIHTTSHRSQTKHFRPLHSFTSLMSKAGDVTK